MKTADFTPLSRPPGRPFALIMQTPMIHQDHASREDLTRVFSEFHADPTEAKPIIGKLYDGWLLDIDDLREWTNRGYSDAFIHLLETFHNQGFSSLRISSDGARIEDLPVFPRL